MEEKLLPRSTFTFCQFEAPAQNSNIVGGGRRQGVQVQGVGGHVPGECEDEGRGGRRPWRGRVQSGKTPP